MSVQARTPFLRKPCGLYPFGYTQSRERIVYSRQQRFANMKSWKDLAFQENHGMTALPQANGRRRAGRTTSGNSEIKVVQRFGHYRQNRSGKGLTGDSNCLDIVNPNPRQGDNCFGLRKWIQINPRLRKSPRLFPDERSTRSMVNFSRHTSHASSTPWIMALSGSFALSTWCLVRLITASIESRRVCSLRSVFRN